jgi:hypothetical protein
MPRATAPARQFREPYPATTGLPMTVWVSPRDHARHDARVNVNTQHGNHMVLDQTAVMAIRPAPRLVEGALAPADQIAMAEWIRRNQDVLIDYWDGIIDTAGTGGGPSLLLGLEQGNGQVMMCSIICLSLR